LLYITLSIGVVSGCAPEIGSEKWCEDMTEKSKGDWTVNEAKAFAEHCVFKSYDD
jgi:hypothetical protein